MVHQHGDGTQAYDHLRGPNAFADLAQQDAVPDGHYDYQQRSMESLTLPAGMPPGMNPGHSGIIPGISDFSQSRYGVPSSMPNTAERELREQAQSVLTNAERSRRLSESLRFLEDLS